MKEAPRGKECHRRAQSKRTRVNTAGKPGRQRDPVSRRVALGRAGEQTAVTLITGTPKSLGGWKRSGFEGKIMWMKVTECEMDDVWMCQIWGREEIWNRLQWGRQLLSTKSDELAGVLLRNFHNKVSSVLGRLYVARGYDNQGVAGRALWAIYDKGVYDGNYLEGIPFFPLSLSFLGLLQREY